MSECQYYEFQAIDRPLSAKEMARLRSVSTRARITPTSFVNVYEYGDFEGDEVWREIDALIATKLPASYDRVISFLVDLRDIAVRARDESRFLRSLEHLQMEHARNPALLLRMKKAGLPDWPEGPLLT